MESVYSRVQSANDHYAYDKGNTNNLYTNVQNIFPRIKFTARWLQLTSQGFQWRQLWINLAGIIVTNIVLLKGLKQIMM